MPQNERNEYDLANQLYKNVFRDVLKRFKASTKEFLSASLHSSLMQHRRLIPPNQHTKKLSHLYEIKETGESYRLLIHNPKSQIVFIARTSNAESTRIDITYLLILLKSVRDDIIINRERLLSLCLWSILCKFRVYRLPKTSA